MPSFNLGDIFRWRGKLADVLAPFAGRTIDGNDVKSMAIKVCGVLPSDAKLVAIYESLRLLAGTTPSVTDIKRVAWRLAGNVQVLKLGKPVYPVWTNQPEPEWVPLQIMKSSRTRKKKKTEGGGKIDEAAFKFEFLALAGMPCTHTITKVWSVRFCKFMAIELGFSKFGEKSFADGAEFVSMRLYGDVIQSACWDGKPNFDQVKVSSSMRKWNQSLIKMRMRITFDCPEGYSHPCHLCWRGYSSCPAACRAEDLQLRLCNFCHKESWFEPEFAKPDRPCIECFHRQTKESSSAKG